LVRASTHLALELRRNRDDSVVGPRRDWRGMWDRVMAVNVKGALPCSRSAAPSLRRAGGAIVNVSSVAGILATGSSLPYGGVEGRAHPAHARARPPRCASTPWLRASWRPIGSRTGSVMRRRRTSTKRPRRPLRWAHTGAARYISDRHVPARRRRGYGRDGRHRRRTGYHLLAGEAHQAERDEPPAVHGERMANHAPNRSRLPRGREGPIPKVTVRTGIVR
jgi:hypothetical protein